jgi:hypothetical protein
LPGIFLNVSKSGVSTSIGRRGATVNFGRRGTRTTLERDFFKRSRLGIPDSGAFLIQDAGWRKEASMDGDAFIDGFAQAGDRGR